MTWNPFETVEDQCPKCSARFDSAAPVNSSESAKVSPGDISLCIYCGIFLVFKPDLRVRLMTPDEMIALDPEALNMLLTAKSNIFILNEQRRKGVT
jgi:hypothetical protein